jgi:methyl coenzyme M reductase subunit C-like uncharacterized protein (methanogenesis marker protein 7)
MLKDRRVLIEENIIKLHAIASNMYLAMVISGNNTDVEYDKIREQISDLQFDLNVVNRLIAEGNV